jgi:UDP-glucose:(glucosyl)LPS alpha-1,2-glucosyltransferase
MPFEENEISIKSSGGTEIIMRGLSERLDAKLTDDFQIICSKVRKIEKDKIRIYWIHDLPEDPETNHLKDQSSRDRFHKFVFCGNWQYSRYQAVCGIAYDDQAVVIDNAIEPAPQVIKEFDTIRLVYSSAPQRGLSILVPVFEELAKKYKNIHLDVFSSFKIYGWEEADKQFEPIYDRIRKHPQMTYHGFTSNAQVKSALLRAHIHAYPSLWLECNSLSVIEAMSAGLWCVHPNLGGLVDTSGGMNFMYQGHNNIFKHTAIFYEALDYAIANIKTEKIQNHLKLVKLYTDSRYAWTGIKAKWEDLLSNLLLKYKTVKSRM